MGSFFIIGSVDLMGETGMAYHFIVKDDICASGPKVYDWYREHQVIKEKGMFHRNNNNRFSLSQIPKVHP